MYTAERRVKWTHMCVRNTESDRSWRGRTLESFFVNSSLVTQHDIAIRYRTFPAGVQSFLMQGQIAYKTISIVMAIVSSFGDAFVSCRSFHFEKACKTKLISLIWMGFCWKLIQKKKKKDATQQRSGNLTRNKHARENVFCTRCMMYDRCTLDILFSIYIQYIYIVISIFSIKL